jgi:methylated-DNA-protein-cysteine methyltransferase-like protein
MSRGPARRIPSSAQVHADAEGTGRSAYDQVYRLVRRIPRGRVMTYGQIANLMARRLSPRAVGWAMHGCPGDVPWQRVVNASGGCSTERLPDMPGGLQQHLLQEEGVEFRKSGTLNLDIYRWLP